MSTYDWPTATWAKPGSGEWRVVDNLQRASESPLSGFVQTLDMPGARWGRVTHFTAQTQADRDQLEGFLLGLSGRVHRVRLWDFERARPRGTINLTGVTTSGSTAQFAEQMTLQGCGAGKTLLSGDWFATPTQLVRCVEARRPSAPSSPSPKPTLARRSAPSSRRRCSRASSRCSST